MTSKLDIGGVRLFNTYEEWCNKRISFQITMTYNIKRPTAAVDCEQLLLASEDVLYPGSDKDESIEEQKARRRRIELQAQHYLQGGELFVLSAHLRGPFADGWINPWARKRKRGERQDGAGRAHGRIDRRETSTQEGREVSIPETTRPSRTWLNTHNAVSSEAGGESSRSPALTPVMKLPKKTLPAMAKLNSPSNDKVLDDECLHCTGPSAVSKPPLSTGRSQPTATGSNHLVTGHDSTAKVAAVRLPEGLQGSLKVVPPSSILPAFEYRPIVRNDRVNESEFEKAQAIAKAQERMFRELSFRSTGDMEHLKSTSQNEEPTRGLQDFTKKRRRINKSNGFSGQDDKSTIASNFSPAALNGFPSVEAEDQPRAERSQSSPPKPRQSDEVNVPRKKDEKSPLSSTVPLIPSHENLSLETDHQPAAQVVPPDPVINDSGPSTSINLLETEREAIVYPVTGDSTQAAIQKAMRSFQEEGFTPLKNSTNHTPNQDSNPNKSLTMSRAFQAKATPEKVFLSRPIKRPIELNNVHDEPMSTQAMIDAASPFTISDHTKSSPISPTKSKPSLSTLNSLNMSSSGGNLTNEYRHDGQQRPQVQPQSFEESGFDLDGAISEALHFLRASQVDDDISKDSNP